MNLLNDETRKQIHKDVLGPLLNQDYDLAASNIPRILDKLHADIPDDKRISYGRVHTIKVLSEFVYRRLVDAGAPVFQIASVTFDKHEDYKSKGVALGMLSWYGLDDYQKVLPYFESAAASPE